MNNNKNHSKGTIEDDVDDDKKTWWRLIAFTSHDCNNQMNKKKNNINRMKE